MLGGQSKETSKHGADAGAHLNGWPFAAERDAAGEGCRGAEEFAEHGAQRYAAFAGKQGSLGLRDATAARIGEIAIEQVTDAERSHDRKQQAPPRRATHGIEAHPEALRQQDEGDDRQTGQRSDHQCQNEKDLPFALPEFGDVAEQLASPTAAGRDLDAFGHDLNFMI